MKGSARHGPKALLTLDWVSTEEHRGGGKEDLQGDTRRVSMPPPTDIRLLFLKHCSLRAYQEATKSAQTRAVGPLPRLN